MRKDSQTAGAELERDGDARPPAFPQERPEIHAAGGCESQRMEIFELPLNLRCRCISFFACLSQAAQDDVLQFGWHALDELPHRLRFVTSHRCDDRNSRLALKRPPSREHLVEDRAKR